ncbi:hypothetical protein I6G79_28915 [Burkholderia plantarii]|nr:hypothetical protein [Burkholderia plantarii]
MLKFGVSDRGHHHIADMALRKSLRDFFRPMLHREDAHARVEHETCHHDPSRPACSPGPSAMNSGPNLANFLSTPASGRLAGRRPAHDVRIGIADCLHVRGS